MMPTLNWRTYNNDCLNVLPSIADDSIDMILCDLPYGTTRAPWDKVIDLQALWKQYRRIIKPHGVIALFSILPFSIDLITPARDLYRYEIIWRKTMPVGFLNANRMPLRAHENILIFYKKLPTYNPQKWKGTPYRKTVSAVQTDLYGRYTPGAARSDDGARYPVDVVEFSNNLNKGNRFHPTEKPVDLLEYLIKTYTNTGDTVLDNAMGSGSTGVAARRLGRTFIGIEKEKKFYDIALNRLITEGINEQCFIGSAHGAGKE